MKHQPPQPSDYEKRAEFAGYPGARPGKWTISFPVPPVCPALWTPADWVTYAEAHGGTWKPTTPSGAPRGASV